MAKTVELMAAVESIVAQASAEPRRDFVFVIGAGVSKPSIHASDKLCEQMEAMIEARGERLRKDPTFPSRFRQCYRSRKDGQEYLEKLITSAHVSPASLLLARLLRPRRLGLKVITPNFDDLLSRALVLLGRDHVVCDHPVVAYRLVEHSSDAPLILHIHGSYRNYDFARDEDEIARRSIELVGYLLPLFTEHPLVVLGYSGQEKDAIMATLRHVWQMRQTHPHFWFCFSRKDAEHVLAVGRHADDLLVVCGSAQDQAEMDRARQGAVAADLGRASRTTADESWELPADRVLSQIISELRLDTDLVPPIDDPVHALAERLRKELPESKSPWVWPADSDDVVRRVLRAADLLRDDEEASRLSEQRARALQLAADEALSQVQSQVRSRRYVSALNTAKERADVWDRLPEDQRLELFDALLEAFRYRRYERDLLLPILDGLAAWRLNTCPTPPQSDELGFRAALMGALKRLEPPELTDDARRALTGLADHAPQAWMHDAAAFHAERLDHGGHPDHLFVFSTYVQTTELRVSCHGLDCYLYDLRSEWGGFQWRLPGEEVAKLADDVGLAIGVDARTDEDWTGRFRIGPHDGWLWSKHLFAPRDRYTEAAAAIQGKLASLVRRGADLHRHTH